MQKGIYAKISHHKWKNTNKNHINWQTQLTISYYSNWNFSFLKNKLLLKFCHNYNAVIFQLFPAAAKRHTKYMKSKKIVNSRKSKNYIRDQGISTLCQIVFNVGSHIYTHKQHRYFTLQLTLLFVRFLIWFPIVPLLLSAQLVSAHLS